MSPWSLREIAALSFCILLFVAPAHAAEGAPELLDILLENGSITQEQYDSLVDKDDLTAEDLAYDSIGLAERPFLRSALYLSRGEWYRALGMPDSAIASWLWHQNTDLEGTVLPELVQAGEVDGALGPFADRRIAAVRATAAIDTSARPN